MAQNRNTIQFLPSNTSTFTRWEKSSWAQDFEGGASIQCTQISEFLPHPPGPINNDRSLSFAVPAQMAIRNIFDNYHWLCIIITVFIKNFQKALANNNAFLVIAFQTPQRFTYFGWTFAEFFLQSTGSSVNSAIKGHLQYVN